SLTAARAAATAATATTPGGRVAGASARAAGTGRGAARRIAAVIEGIRTVFGLRGHARDHRAAATLSGVRRATRAHRSRRLRSTALGALLLRIALLVELDEFIFADHHGRDLRPALDHRVGNAGGVQRDGAHGVVVAGNHVVHVIRRAIGVNHGDHGD